MSDLWSVIHIKVATGERTLINMGLHYADAVMQADELNKKARLGYRYVVV